MHAAQLLLQLLCVNTILPSVAGGPATVYVYDVTYATSLPLAAGYEEQLLVAAIGGLSNRADPNLYVVSQSIDSTWLSLLSAPGGWLSQSTLVNISGIENLVTNSFFQSFYSGVVLYDPNIWPTSSLASTSAGVENLLPICYRPSDPTSLYNKLVAGGPKLPVRRSFVGAFNTSNPNHSIKLPAYQWAIQVRRVKLPDDIICYASQRRIISR
jgi:hypothetical protein